MQAVDWTGSDSTEQLMRATSLQNENYYLKKKKNNPATAAMHFYLK